MRCDLCQRDAVTFVRYNGSHLCGAHFSRYVEKRVKREMRKQVDLSRGGTVAVAVSGGKDSMVALDLLRRFSEGRGDVELHCVTVDEGIAGYRPASVGVVRRYCSEHGVPLHLVSFEAEFGLTMDMVRPHVGDSSPCTYCGVFRRKCMNGAARAIGADLLATGHNLDDMAQSVLMDFARGDLERLARLGPHRRVQPGLVPRFMPLRMIPERETLLYAMVNGIPFHDGECPYWREALRNQYRDVVDALEARSPGSKFSILSSYDELAPMLAERYPPARLGVCACGEPAHGSVCKACELSAKVRARIAGP